MCPPPPFRPSCKPNTLRSDKFTTTIFNLECNLYLLTDFCFTEIVLRVSPSAHTGLADGTTNEKQNHNGEDRGHVCCLCCSSYLLVLCWLSCDEFFLVLAVRAIFFLSCIDSSSMKLFLVWLFLDATRLFLFITGGKHLMSWTPPVTSQEACKAKDQASHVLSEIPRPEVFLSFF